MSTRKSRPDWQSSVAEEARAWDSIAKDWHAWTPLMREWYAPATELMLDLARLQAGDRVLDIAAGDCDQSIAAAKRLGPQGFVLAVDLAEEMLAIGARIAREAGLHNIDTQVMDGANIDLPDSSFDAVICRFALMFLPDPVRALEGINRVLENEGRVSVVVYAADGDPEFLKPVSVVSHHLGISAKLPYSASLGDMNLLRRSLEVSGFRGIETHLLNLPICMASAGECTRYLRSTSPTLNKMISQLSQDEGQRVWDKVQDALTVLEGNDGFSVDHKVIVAAGTAV